MAQEVNLVKTASVPSRTYIGATDIIGIKPGMTLSDVSSLLQADGWSEPEVKTNTLTMRVASVSVSSQNYPSTLFSFKKNGEETIIVHFATPSTGGGVVSIGRVVKFSSPETAPKVTDVISGLNQKYGSKYSYSSSVGSFGDSLYIWVYNDKAQNICNGGMFNNCRGGPLELQPTNTESYRDALKQGAYLTVSAEVSVHSFSDRGRVSELKISVNDVEKKLITLEQAIEQLKASAQTLYEKNAIPQRAPRL